MTRGPRPRRRAARSLKTRSWKLVDETSGKLDFATSAAKVASGPIPQIEDYLAAHAAVRRGQQPEGLRLHREMPVLRFGAACEPS